MDVVAASAPALSAAPGKADRILGYDAARAFALLGMIVVHFGLVLAADHERPGWAAAVMHILDGRAAATFVVLAGVGLTLRSRKTAGESRALTAVRRTLINRGLFLFAVGFVNLVIWPGDILRVYGVSLLLAAWFVAAPDRRLLGVTLGFALGFVVLILTVDYEQNWEWATLTYRRLWSPAGLVRNLFYDGFRSVFPWTGFVFFGMWLGRRDLRDRAINTRVLATGLGVALAAEGGSRICLAYFRAHPSDLDAVTIQALFGTDSMPPLPLFLLTAGGMAVAVIALCVRLAEARPGAGWLQPLAATGQMAFTWYAAHIILGLGSVDALKLTGTEPLPAAEAVGVLFFAIAVLTSWLWKRRFHHCPLEWVMRKVAG